jgi:hypothetical protein
MSQPCPVSQGATGLQGVVRLSLMSGVCLTEVMIGLAAGAIVLAATLGTFNTIHHHVIDRQRVLAYQQDLRLGLEVFEQEVRLAEAETIAAATPDEFQFSANLNAQWTSTTGDVIPGQTALAVQDGSGWGAGKTVLLCAPHVCETHRLARIGQRAQLVLAEPARSLFPVGASVEVRSRVRYYTRRDESGTVRLMRMVDEGASTLIGGIGDIHFSYRDGSGLVTSVPSQVKRVVVEIQSERLTRRAVREVSLRS